MLNKAPHLANERIVLGANLVGELLNLGVGILGEPVLGRPEDDGWKHEAFDRRVGEVEV